ncbi:MAG: VUT family protein [Clostridia bacterium]|nr:VUT family protein [Clostridia bacterium]
MKDRLKRSWADTRLLFGSVPAVLVTLFTVSVVVMNILAGKTILQSELIALDGGFLISWLSFLCMDVATKAFGPKAATKLSVFAMLVNLFVCALFAAVCAIPTPWEDFSAFNQTLGGTWFVLLSSCTAFFVSAVINNFLNWAIAGRFRKKPDGRLAYAVSSFVSTFIGQFADNLVFAVMLFMVFAPAFWGFSWTFTQCVGCSLLGAALELVMEVVFSPLGYRILRAWERDGVGEAYRKRGTVQ